MPELPDIVVYIEALEKRIKGSILERVRIANPFLLRTAVPPLSSVEGKKVVELRRLGKRICFGLEGDLWLVLHLMIAGRLKWREAGKKPVTKIDLAAFDFATGTLLLTEAGSKRRASLHVLGSADDLRQFDRGGLEVLEATLAEFTTRLVSESHTVKRALTDPRLFSGIGNAYSDEILHRARLSPVKLTRRLSSEGEVAAWCAGRPRIDDHDSEGVLMPDVNCPECRERSSSAALHLASEPCPVCGTPVQRIRYADNETNYCARCQTEGRLLADRALSRLLKGDWPRSLEELDEIKG